MENGQKPCERWQCPPRAHKSGDAPHIWVKVWEMSLDDKEDELERIKRRKLEDMRKGVNQTRETKPSSHISGKPVDLTDSTFTSFVKENSLAVVDFWAPWCGPCRFVSPVVEDIAKDYVGIIAFGKLDVDQNHKIANQYGIVSIPTIMVFKNGKRVDQIIGAMPRQSLEPRITVHL